MPPLKVFALPKVPQWRKQRRGQDPNTQRWVHCSNHTTSCVVPKAAAGGPFLSPALALPHVTPQLEPPPPHTHTSIQTSLYSRMGLNTEPPGSRRWMNEWLSGKMRTQKLKARLRAPLLPRRLTLSDISPPTPDRAAAPICTMGKIAPIHHCVPARMK